MDFPLEIDDLCTTSPWRRRIALARPFAGVALFAVIVHIGWWWLTPLVMFAIFVTVVTVTHDVVHRCLGLGRRGTDWALFLMGLVLLESGHAYRITHLQHHRRFPHPTEDPEGYPAGMTLLARSVMARFSLGAFGGGRGAPGVTARGWPSRRPCRFSLWPLGSCRWRRYQAYLSM